MRLKCNKCRKDWQEESEGPVALVQCPECYSVSYGVARDHAQWVLGGDDDAANLRLIKMRPTGLRCSLDSDWDSLDDVRRAAHVCAIRAFGNRGNGVPKLRAADPVWTSEIETEISVGCEGSAIEDSVRRIPANSAAPSGPKDADLTGQTIAGYVVKRMLGSGGMGTVCLACQKSLNRDVALKILPDRFAGNRYLVLRFRREALSAAQLTHHNVVQVYDVGTDRHIHYIAMEYVRGESLGELVLREGPLRPAEAIGYILQAARGLKFAHERGIVHRDIKPHNLMVNEHGVVKVADMGIAKMRNFAEEETDDQDPVPNAACSDLTDVSAVIGTPAYMSPEQARNAASVDARADQYSLGCTLFYLCSGSPPYIGCSTQEIIEQHMDAPVPALDDPIQSVHGALNTVLSRMLAKCPADRYEGMGALADDLEALIVTDAHKLA